MLLKVSVSWRDLIIGYFTYRKLLTMKHVLSRILHRSGDLPARGRQSKIGGDGCGCSFWTKPIGSERPLTPSPRARRRKRARRPDADRAALSVRGVDAGGNRAQPCQSCRPAGRSDFVRVRISCWPLSASPGRLSRATPFLARSGAGNGHILIVRSIRLSRDCARSWPSVADRPPLVRSVRGVGYIFCVYRGNCARISSPRGRPALTMIAAAAWALRLTGGEFGCYR